MALDPTRSTPEGRQALADVLLYCRKQVGAENWEQFSEVALQRGWELPASMLKKMSPGPQYATAPNPGVLFVLEAMDFKFPNGEKITAFSLVQVLLGLRLPDGVLVANVHTSNGQIGP